MIGYSKSQMVPQDPGLMHEYVKKSNLILN